MKERRTDEENVGVIVKAEAAERRAFVEETGMGAPGKTSKDQVLVLGHGRRIRESS